MDIQIRKTTIEDLEPILQMNLELFNYEAQFTDSYNREWTYSKVGKTYFRNVCKWAKNLFGFIATDKGKPVGYIAAVIYKTPYRKFEAICELENMFVVDGYRDRGVGSMLINALTEEVRKRDLSKIQVGAFITNTRAINFYEKSGFGTHILVLEKDL